jgi:hypothetical protein
MILLVDSLGVSEPVYFAGDAYYASGKIVRGLLKKGDHLITRVKRNAVAYVPALKPSADKPKKRGRPKTYGDKIPIAKMLYDEKSFSYAKSPIYGETGVTLSYRTVDLLWRPVGVVVRFVIVRHPTRGSIFLMATDLNLSPLDIIEIYGLRFKIEVSFKQSLRGSWHFCLSLLDGSYDADRTQKRQPVSAHENSRLSQCRPAQACGLSSSYSARTHCPGTATDSIGHGSGNDLAILRLMDSHHPSRTCTL